MKKEVVLMVLAVVGVLGAGCHFLAAAPYLAGRFWDAAMGAAIAFNLGMFCSNWFEWRDRCEVDEIHERERALAAKWAARR
jgi:hypothetical protein